MDRAVTIQPPKPWLQWTLHCAAGEILGIGAAGAIAFVVNRSLGEPEGVGEKIMVLLAMLAAGAIEGTLLGILQWKVLVKLFSNLTKKEWLSLTVAAAVAGWLIGMLPSLFFISQNETDQQQGIYTISQGMMILIFIAAGLLLGAMFGLFQWFSLRKHTRDAAQWIWANALGWGTGIGWIFLFASLPDENTTLFFNVLMGICGGLLAGLSVGAITGIYLIKFSNHLK